MPPAAVHLEAVGPLRRDRQLTDQVPHPVEVGAPALVEPRHPLLDVAAPSGVGVEDSESERG